MAGKVKKSGNKKSLLIAGALMLLIIGLPLFAAVSQKYQNNQQVLAGTTAAVSIIDFQFSPASITVAAGTTVTWTNMSASGADHTTSSDSQTGAEHWDSGLTNKTGAGGLPATFSHTFNTPGTYTYHCNVHTFMRGTVVVTAAAAAPTATTAPAAPTATIAPAAPTAITPTLVCVGGNAQPPCATIPPTQAVGAGNPTAVPTLNVAQPTPGSSGGGSTNNPIAFLIYFILLILQFLQKLI